MPPKPRTKNDTPEAGVKPVLEGPVSPGAKQPAVTNYSEIQDNELEALRSIYMTDFRDVKGKPSAWNVCLGIG